MNLAPEQLKKAREYINTCIAQAYTSGRLPTMRDMLAQSHCTRMALEHIIAEYVEAWYLVRKDRSGFYLRSQSPNGNAIELVACHDEGNYSTSGLLYECILAMINTFSKHGYSARMTSISQLESTEKYLEISHRADSAAFVLLLPQTRELVSTFQLTGKPVLSLFPQGRFTGVNQLVDSSQLVAIQMNHLMELGHRRILYLREQFDQYQSLTEFSRIIDYHRIMAKNNLQVPEHWHTIYPSGKLDENLELAFSREPTPTALIISDWEAPVAFAFLWKHNLTIGKDVSVVATDGCSYLNLVSPTVSTTVMNSVQISEDAWHMLDRQFQGAKDFECREVEISFRQGESSGRIQ
ncbi:MAG: substrate-binding domain-containing protein [Lentisphaeria bacterium]|nr:substrate-binding domain-containing protein [Lentisphaeria bacterium]